jgi:hypothetical protein
MVRMTNCLAMARVGPLKDAVARLLARSRPRETERLDQPGRQIVRLDRVIEQVLRVDGVRRNLLAGDQARCTERVDRLVRKEHGEREYVRNDPAHHKSRFLRVLATHLFDWYCGKTRSGRRDLVSGGALSHGLDLQQPDERQLVLLVERNDVDDAEPLGAAEEDLLSTAPRTEAPDAPNSIPRVGFGSGSGGGGI